MFCHIESLFEEQMFCNIRELQLNPFNSFIKQHKLYKTTKRKYYQENIEHA